MQLNELVYLVSQKKTKEDSIYLSPNFFFLIFKPKEEHDDPSPELPVKLYDFIYLYELAKENGTPARIFVPREVTLRIIKTSSGGIKTYSLFINDIECKVDNEAFIQLPVWLLNGIRSSFQLEARTFPPSLKDVYALCNVCTIELLTEGKMVFTFQEAFVNGNVCIQFDWNLGVPLMPSVNSIGRGFRFYIEDGKLLSAFEKLYELSKTGENLVSILKKIKSQTEGSSVHS